MSHLLHRGGCHTSVCRVTGFHRCRTESIFYQYYQYIQYNDLIFRLIPAEGRAPFCVKGGTPENLSAMKVVSVRKVPPDKG